MGHVRDMMGHVRTYLLLLSSSSTSISLGEKGMGERGRRLRDVVEGYPRKRGKDGAARCFARLLASGVNAADLAAARDNYVEEVRILGHDEAHTLHGSTFLDRKGGGKTSCRRVGEADGRQAGREREKPTMDELFPTQEMLDAQRKERACQT